MTSQTSGHIIDEVGGRGGEPRPLQTPHHPEGVQPQLQGEAVPTPPSWGTQLPTQQLLQLLYLEPASKIVEKYGSLEEAAFLAKKRANLKMSNARKARKMQQRREMEIAANTSLS